MNYEEPTARLRPRRGQADGIHFRRSGYVAAAAAKTKSPQAVFKVISQARGHRAKVLMHYVARTESEMPLQMEDENGLQVAGAESIEAAYNDWRQDFERAAPGQKRPPRHVSHMIFSGDCAQARAVQSAVAELMQEQFGRDGYRYLMVLHTDTDHPHVHVILNHYNRDHDKPKVRINPPELLACRQQFAQKLRERGVEQHATRRRDRISVLEAVTKGIEDLQADGPWYESRMRTAARGHAFGADSSAEATPDMLKWAADIEAKSGIALEATDFPTVRDYLDKHSTQFLGKDNPVASTVSDKPRAVDAFAKRRAMAKAVAKIKADVKATTLPFSQERRERMALLRQIDAQLIDPAAPDYSRLMANLSLKFGKDRERIQDHIRALSDPTSVVQDHKRRRQREGAIDKIIARNIEAVRAARIDLVRAPGLGIVEGYRLGYQLKAYERELQRIRTLHAFGAGKAAAPGTAAEVAAQRTQAAALARVERAADKLERLGPWHEPNPGRDKGGFDAFSKRKALTNIVTNLADTLAGAGVEPSHQAAQRVQQLRETLVEQPAPNYARLVDNLRNQVASDRLRADFEARRAAHPTTPAADRAAIREKTSDQLLARVARLNAARRELTATTTLSDREQAQLVAGVKRMERVLKQAARVVDQPPALAAKLAELDRAPAPEKTYSNESTQQPTRSIVHGTEPSAGYLPGYGLKGTPAAEWRQPELYAPARGLGGAAEGIDGLRTLSGVDLDGRAVRGQVLLPDHARHHLENQRTEHLDGLRRPDNGLGPGGGSQGQGSSQGQRIAPVAAPGDRLTADQLGDLIARVHARLVEAGRWDDPTPYRSGLREFYQGDDGRRAPPLALDAFAKRREMLADIDRLRPEVDAAHVNFTPEMRRQLAAVRAMRADIAQTPARDLDGVFNRLTEKIANDQLRIEARSDKPATSAVEMLERRRSAERIANRNLQSVADAKRELETSTTAKPMQKFALYDRLKSMTQAMERYSGKGLER